MMTIERAERLLSRVQNKANSPSRAVIRNQQVTVSPLPQNAFLISGVPLDGDGYVFRMLTDIGASLSLNANATAYEAVVTWDSMLHRLVMEETLVLD